MVRINSLYFPEKAKVWIEFWPGRDIERLYVYFGSKSKNRASCKITRKICRFDGVWENYEHDIAFIALPGRLLADLIDPHATMTKGVDKKKLYEKVQNATDIMIFQSKYERISIDELTRTTSIEDGVVKIDNSYVANNEFILDRGLNSLIPPLAKDRPADHAFHVKSQLARSEEERATITIYDPNYRSSVRKAKGGAGSKDPWVPFSDLSDGYRALITLGLLIGRGFEVPVSAGNLRPETVRPFNGIVLIDEIDASMHPRWRMSLLRRLKATFPGVQFIFTTHDPLVLRGMDARNVVRLEKDEDGGIKPVKIEHEGSMLGYNIDDILISEIFALDTIRDDADAEGFARYIQLLMKQSRETQDKGDRRVTASEEAELRQLEKRYQAGYAGALDPRDRLILPAIDRIYAKIWRGGEKQEGAKDNGSSKDMAIEAIAHLLELRWGISS